MKIGFVPIDNRPVCYTLPKMLAGVDSSVEFFIPDRKFLGDLTKTADIENLFIWLENLPKLDAIILSLDTLTYGGLIPSRRCPESFEQINLRVQKLEDILKQKQCKVYAFSSIMRISNNNYNEEEKEYWNLYGKKLFEYSYNIHKSGGKVVLSDGIPQDILTDWLSTRKRNFEINKLYLELQKKGLFEVLIFSKDDCAQYGLNVQEAQELECLGGISKTGADEIPLTLLARAISGEVKVCPVFLENDSKELISNYEDISIEKSVLNQIELSGCKVSDFEDADIILYVNNFRNNQGEIVMRVDTDPFDGVFKVPQKMYMIADVRFANGADNNFIEELLKNKFKDEEFYGYSAWNTSANTLGSLICGAKMKFLAKEYNHECFSKLQITRFLDDWAYQANVRQSLSSPLEDELCQKMKPFEEKLTKVIGTEFEVKYSYPWKRLFEVEIEFN